VGRFAQVAVAAAAVAVLATVGSTTRASGATDLTARYSKNLATAIFARRFGVAWNYIAPQYRAQIKKSVWRRCAVRFLAESKSDTIKRVQIAGSRRLPSTLPALGRVRLVDVSIQVLYTLARSHTLRATVVSAYWTKLKGKWYAVWTPPQLSAYKAGRCTPQALY
jgi:hypothetical protein